MPMDQRIVSVQLLWRKLKIISGMCTRRQAAYNMHEESACYNTVFIPVRIMVILVLKD